MKSIQETEDKIPKVPWNFVNDIKAKKRASPSDNIEPRVWYEWLILDSEISIDEISKASLKLKNGKSVGADVISNEMIKCCVCASLKSTPLNILIK